MRYIARLKYTDKAALEADLIAKGIKDEQGKTADFVNAIVELGTLTEQSGTDAEGNPIFTELDGYHADIDLTQEIDFGSALTAPSTPHHGVKWAEGATILTP